MRRSAFGAAVECLNVLRQSLGDIVYWAKLARLHWIGKQGRVDCAVVQSVPLNGRGGSPSRSDPDFAESFFSRSVAHRGGSPSSQEGRWA